MGMIPGALFVGGPFAGEREPLSNPIELRIYKKVSERDHGKIFFLEHPYDLHRLADTAGNYAYIFVHASSGSPTEWTQDVIDAVWAECVLQDCTFRGQELTRVVLDAVV